MNKVNFFLALVGVVTALVAGNYLAAIWATFGAIQSIRIISLED
jgi:hypothetical protein